MSRDDLVQLCRFNNDVEIELSGGGDPPAPQSLERLQAQFDADVSKGGRDGMGFAIEADGKFIGQCALFNYGEVAQTAELGITIGDKNYLGAGYGRDAVKVLLEYGFKLRNLRRIHLTVNATNDRAIRAYEACGFVREGRLREHVWQNGAYIDLICMGVLRSEYAG